MNKNMLIFLCKNCRKSFIHSNLVDDFFYISFLEFLRIRMNGFGWAMNKRFPQKKDIMSCN